MEAIHRHLYCQIANISINRHSYNKERKRTKDRKNAYGWRLFGRPLYWDFLSACRDCSGMPSFLTEQAIL
jgi:hypothetical protein